MFRFHAIILNVTKIRENSTRIVLLTKEYGKISCWMNKKTSVGFDFGDIVEVCIFREHDKNIIKQLDAIRGGFHKNWNYQCIISFLETLKIIQRLLPEGQESTLIYKDMIEFLEYASIYPIHTKQIILLQMRIIKHMGSLNKESAAYDGIIEYIYKHIDIKPLTSILKSEKIEEKHIVVIQKIIFHSIHLLYQ